MEVAEEQRLYQVALEYRRLVRSQADGIVTLEGESNEAEVAHDEQETALEVAFLEDLCQTK